MRRSLGMLALCALATVAACGSDSTAPAPPPTSQFNFKIDALTCVGSGTILFFLDGSQIGAQAMSAGSSSSSFTTSPGPHTVGARAADNTFVWPTSNHSFPPNTLYTVVLTC